MKNSQLNPTQQFLVNFNTAKLQHNPFLPGYNNLQLPQPPEGYNTAAEPNKYTDLVQRTQQNIENKRLPFAQTPTTYYQARDAAANQAQPPKQNAIYEAFKPMMQKQMIPENHLQGLGYQFGNFYSNIPPQQTQQRSLAGKDLTRLTTHTLSNLNGFQGLRYENPPALAGMQNLGDIRGAYRPDQQAIYINPQGHIPMYDPVPLINHEAQHAIEHRDPKVSNTLHSFLSRRFGEDKTIPKRYIPELYKGMQNIINFPAEFTRMYTPERLFNPVQSANHGINNINIGDLSAMNRGSLSNRFDEIPAFLMQGMSTDGHQWNWNRNSNQTSDIHKDSASFLNNSIRDLYSQYVANGLNATVPNSTPPDYRFNNARTKFANTINEFNRQDRALNNPNIQKRRKLNNEEVYVVPNDQFAHGGYVRRSLPRHGLSHYLKNPTKSNNPLVHVLLGYR